MAYRILVDGELLWDAATDADVVSSASISQSVNAAAYLDMEVSPLAAPRVSEGSSVIEVRWGDATLFHGRATEVAQGIDGRWSVSAVSDVDRLNDVLVRPHSTSGEVGERCPDTVGGYFSWLIERYNERAVGGYRIDVRVNQGDRLADGPVSVSDDTWPTVAAAIEGDVLSRGGYLDFTPYAGGGVIDLYADLHDANAQVVDLGENVTDITVTRSVEAQRTALVPYARVDGGGEVTLSQASEQDLQLVRNAGYSVFGDAIYDGSFVAEYGYREERREFDGVTSVADLVREAIPCLRTMVAPTLTVECRAVDMALYREGHEHLRVGQAVRVRSELHGVDEYLAVQDVQLDLLDPSQTTYTLGVSYDTLTGGQSAFLSRLNGSINDALDRVTDAEGAISHVVNDVDVEYYVSDSPDEPVGGEWGVGTVTAVDNKYVFSHLRQEQADGTIVVSDPTLLTTQVRHSLQLRRDLGDEVVWVSYVAANHDVTDEAAGIVRLYGQMGGWDAEEQGAVTVAFGFQDSAYQAAGDGESLAGVGVVTEKSSDIDLGRADIVSYVDDGRVGVYVRLTGKVLVNLYADGEGFSTPFVELTSEPSGTKVFDLKDTQTTYESAILQADNAIRLYVAATYATKGQLGEVESAFDVRANQIEASVSEKMDTSVANQTFVNQSTFDQFSDSITTTVSETVQTADEAYTKASQVEQTVDGIEVTLTETAGKAEDALSAASSASGDLANYVIDGTPVGSGSLSGWQVVNGVYQRTFPGGENHVDFSLQNARRTWGVGQALVFSAEFRVVSGTFSSSDSINIYEGGGSWQAFIIYPAQAAGGGWVQLSSTLNGTGVTTTATKSYGFSSYVTSSGAKVLQMRNVQILDGNAAKTATNYLRFDSSGLCVGNMTGTLGYNALITSSQYQIRNGSTVLSSFGASSVSLGQNSTSASISMCGGRGYISVGNQYGGTGTSRSMTLLRGYASGGLVVGATESTDTQSGMSTAFASFDGPGQIAAIAGAGGTYINTEKVKTGPVRICGNNITIGSSASALRGIWAGSVVKSIASDQWIPVFSSSEYASIVGRTYKPGDVVLFFNGDSNANNNIPVSAYYAPSSGNVGAFMYKAQGGMFRFNYLIAAVA